MDIQLGYKLKRGIRNNWYAAKQLPADLFSLFFPRLCAACGEGLISAEQVICLLCRYALPYTSFHKDESNPMARQLWGRFDFRGACALFYFRKGSGVQNLVHHLKYRNHPEIGFLLGEIYAARLAQEPLYAGADLIVPVPLHASKERKRRYNQSEHFARELSSSLGIPVSVNNLVRKNAAATQTKKSRFYRSVNSGDAFLVSNPGLFREKHILLADDVLTTGATAEACCLALSAIPGIRISIVTIAFTE